MVERNELNMSILTLLDENIASAKTSNQVTCFPRPESTKFTNYLFRLLVLFDHVFLCYASNLYIYVFACTVQEEAVAFMENVRSAMLKYITV
jgi:hypothetical protein